MNTEMDITIFLFSELSELLSLISVKIKSLHIYEYTEHLVIQKPVSVASP